MATQPCHTSQTGSFPQQNHRDPQTQPQQSSSCDPSHHPSGAATQQNANTQQVQSALSAQEQTSSAQQHQQQQQNPPQSDTLTSGPTATAPFLQDFNLVSEAAKRAQMAVVMRDLESVSL